MKKKLLTLLTLVAFGLSFVTGCNLISTDSKLDLAQVVATVGDEDYKDEITKRDLLIVFLNQGGNYIQQGMSAEDVLDGFYEVLIQRRILVQEAVKALIEEKNLDLTLSDVLEEKEDEKISDRMKVLLRETGSTDGEINRLYNTAYNAALSAEESQILSEINKLKLQDDEDYVAPSTEEKTKRPVRTDKTENEPVAKEKFKYRNVAATKFGEEVENGEDAADSAEREYIKRAYRSYVSNIQQQDIFDEGKGWDYYINSYFERMLVEQLEAQLINEHSRLRQEALIRELGNVNEGTVTDSELFKEVKQRYEQAQKSQGQQFEADISANITKIEGLSDSTYLLYNAAEGKYGFVRHILFKYSDAAALELTRINSMDWTDAKKKAERNALAAKIRVKDLREADEDKNFTPDEKIWENVPAFMTFFNTAFGGTANGANTYGDEIYKATKAPNYVTESDEDQTTVATNDIQIIKDKFIDYEYAYSGDTASLGSSTNMLLNAFGDPFLSNQKYVAEFSEASRNVINAGVGCYTTVVTDFGIHLILCTDEIVADKDFAFDPAIAERVIRSKDSELSIADKDSAIYKIFQVVKNERVSAASSDYTAGIIKEYEEKIVRNDQLMSELLSQVRS